jgi:competence protein ComEA
MSRMKYVLAGLAVVAAVAALFFRPPTLGPAVVPPAIDTAARSASGGRQAAAAAPAAGAPTTRPAPVRAVVVYVAGEVHRPGVYALAADQRAVDALARAGGALPDADLVAVNLAATLTDGDEIAVPKIGAGSRSSRERRPDGPHSRSGRAHSRHGKHAAHRRTSDTPESAAGTDPRGPIDINTADAHELERIPGIGASLAARIVAYRALNGPFGSIDELADVSGITPRVQDALGEATFVR